MKASSFGRKAARALAGVVALGAAVTAFTAYGPGGTTMAAAHAAAATQSSPFRVVYIGPFSGEEAVIGPAEKAGLEAAAQAINAEGGILGHKVVVSTMDDGLNGTTAVSDAEKILAGARKPNLIVAGAQPADALPMADALAKTPILQITPGGGQPQLINPSKLPYLFYPGADPASSEYLLLAQMKQKGLMHVGLITGDDPTGLTFEAEETTAARQLHMTVTATVSVPDSAVSASAQLQQVLASKPQALVVGGYTPAEGPILAARASLDPTIPLYGDSFFAAADLGANTTAAQRSGVIEQDSPYLVRGTGAEATATWRAFEKATSTFNPKPVISLYADITTYDALMEARAAAVKAGTITGAAVPAALGKISLGSDVRGFLGAKLLYAPTRHVWGAAASDFIYPRAGASPGGLLTPGS